MQHSIKGSWLKWMQNQMDPNLVFGLPLVFSEDSIAFFPGHLFMTENQESGSQEELHKEVKTILFSIIGPVEQTTKKKQNWMNPNSWSWSSLFPEDKDNVTGAPLDSCKGEMGVIKRIFEEVHQKNKGPLFLPVQLSRETFLYGNQASVRRKVSIKLLSKMAHSCRSHWQLTLPFYWKQRVIADQLHCPIFTPSKENPQILNKWDLGKHYYAFALQDRSLHSHYLSSLTYRKDVSSMIKNVKWMFGEEH